MNNLPDIRLRAIEPEDLDLLYRIENDQRLWNVGSTNVPYSRYTLHDYIATSSDDIYADRQVRLVIENAAGETVGMADVVRFDPKDERPPVGEYWKSRSPSSFDVSGYITSKAAGLRLLRMVKYILDTDEPKTWLDYREYEPNYIQFKFSADEFDVEKLSDLSIANGGIITEQIVRQCVKPRG